VAVLKEFEAGLETGAFRWSLMGRLGWINVARKTFDAGIFVAGTIGLYESLTGA
jgi:hypothetical protein